MLKVINTPKPKGIKDKSSQTTLHKEVLRKNVFCLTQLTFTNDNQFWIKQSH